MITAEFVGGAELIRQLEAITPNIHDNLVSAITRLSFELEAKVKAEKLSGQVLNTRTNKLRSSINSNVQDNGNSILGQVGTNVNYGLMHEFGFQGVETIGAHLRTIKMAWGKSISPKTINVRAHSRKVDYPERSFLRSALKDMEPMIVSQIDLAISKGIK